MFQQSKFNLQNNEALQEQVEEWVDQFFFTLMNTLNGFFCSLSVEETLERIKCIDFGDLVLEQLENEEASIKAMAVAKIRELAVAEMVYIQAYTE